jgi:hypothetical protein
MGGIVTRFHYAPETDTTAVERIQDCTPIVDTTKALHNEGIHGSSEMRHAARLPMVIVEQYCNERGIGFDEFMQNDAHLRAVLNDPALAAFRIWPGKI